MGTTYTAALRHGCTVGAKDQKVLQAKHTFPCTRLSHSLIHFHHHATDAALCDFTLCSTANIQVACVLPALACNCLLYVMFTSSHKIVYRLFPSVLHHKRLPVMKAARDRAQEAFNTTQRGLLCEQTCKLVSVAAPGASASIASLTLFLRPA